MRIFDIVLLVVFVNCENWHQSSRVLHKNILTNNYFRIERIFSTVIIRCKVSEYIFYLIFMYDKIYSKSLELLIVEHTLEIGIYHVILP